MFLFYSCDDIAQISDQINQMKDAQTQILLQQDKIIKNLADLDKKVANSGKTNNKPKENNKRKTPDPNFSHNIEIGNSIVLGNPDASVTVTKFTDYQ
tara:strand:+ start:239 stop:529 length:291 start_codon:yes stop_codon:yes gene_type:complete